MRKRYSVARNRWYMKMLVNVPYFFEVEDEPEKTSQGRAGLTAAACALGMLTLPYYIGR